MREQILSPFQILEFYLCWYLFFIDVQQHQFLPSAEEAVCGCLHLPRSGAVDESIAFQAVG